MLGAAHIINVDPASSKLYVANCYTQEFYGNDGKRYADLDAVCESLQAVFEYADSHQLDVYLPKIGTGLGGLSWNDEVKPTLQKLDEDFERVETYVCIYGE